MISGTPLDLNDPRLLAISETERHFLEAEYDDYAATNASGTAFCRSAALILMALLLLRHALSVPDTDGDDDASTFFSEAAAMAATQFAFVVQSGQARGLHFTIASAPPATPHQETV
ncbi:RING/FYVE/PHD zinc finger superfamily protein [Actinidia rufa]|uniref:RING/FYVE/PHD zinc finger superfamily protein n=1 Tax=Actinidia rufa TaxID=165716 RepID=A0A7J0GU90_9ERIC|nr:RING/FYVE/PHD zinc finger superfamily protein [Actinidia rufa]